MRSLAMQASLPKARREPHGVAPGYWTAATISEVAANNATSTPPLAKYLPPITLRRTRVDTAESGLG
jgi:hypothetical protein